MTQPRYVMEFERPLVELEDKLDELRRLDLAENPELAAEIDELAAEIEQLRIDDLSSTSRRGTASRSRATPSVRRRSTTSRRSSPTSSSCTATALSATTRRSSPGSRTLDGRRVAVLGHRKGTNTKENIRRNFGSPAPRGLPQGRCASCASPRSSGCRS